MCSRHVVVALLAILSPKPTVMLRPLPTHVSVGFLARTLSSFVTGLTAMVGLRFQCLACSTVAKLRLWDCCSFRRVVAGAYCTIAKRARGSGCQKCALTVLLPRRWQTGVYRNLFQCEVLYDCTNSKCSSNPQQSLSWRSEGLPVYTQASSAFLPNHGRLLPC